MAVNVLLAAVAALAAVPVLIVSLLLLDALIFLVVPSGFWNLFLDTKPASVAVPGTADPEKGHGPVHRNAGSPDKLMLRAHDGVKTLWDNFDFGAKISPDAPCLGHRNPGGGKQSDGRPAKASAYVWQSYSEVKQAALSFGSGLQQLELVPEVDELEGGVKLRPLAMFLKNCTEWIIAELGLFSICGCTVPIYETLGEENVSHVLSQTACKTVVCKAAEAVKVAQAVGSTPSIKAIVLVGGDADGAAAAACKEAGLAMHTFEEVLETGAENARDPLPPSDADVATFCYTSGTTGPPKGAVLTHRNVVSTCAAVNLVARIDRRDAHLSYLPLAHVFERCVVHAALGNGACIGFSQGDPRLIPDDLKCLRPTMFPSVPRLLNRMHDKVLSGAAKSPLKNFLLTAALAHKGLRLRKAQIPTHWLWDRVIFKAVKKAMGLDRCRILLSGSAPLAPHVLQFLRCVLAPAQVVEGYGATENCAGVTVQVSMTLGDVGPPLRHNEIKLVSVEEMGYRWNDTKHETRGKNIDCEGRGEVWVRGHNVFPGYYKMEDATKDALTEGGWIQTGDVGLWLTNGALKIIDRKKNIFKLSQGEYIAAEKIEETYTQAELVQQAFVYGDSFQHCLVAIVYPDPEALAAWAKSNKPDLDTKDGQAVSDCKELNAAIMDQIKAAARGAKLHGFEICKAIHVAAEAFSEDNGLLTPTFKLKRPIAKKHFADHIDAMYAGLEGSLKHSVKDD